jgi:uncharacterized protein YqjF (DUF2071 family)
MAVNPNLSRNSPPGETLSVVSHRPYALPKRPWTMMQRWNDLLFAHWPIPAAKLEALLPAGLQVNLRTYVRERNTNRAGVYFFCLEASNPLAVMVAKTVFHLPYHWARMSIKVRGEREFTYQSERLLSAKPVRFRAHYRGLGQVRAIDQSRPGTIEHFLTERYCLFTTNRRGQLLRGDIHHMPWPLEAAEAEIELNELPSTYGIEIPHTAPLLHYSRELVVYLWSLDKVWGKLPVLEAAGARTAEIV